MALQLNIDAMAEDCPPSYAINADASVALRAYLLQRNGVYTHDGHALSTLTEDAIDFSTKRAVGKGASGHVYYATLKGSGTPVALKEIVIEDKQHRDEIHRELAVLLSKYDSTFVIRNYGAFWSVTDGCVTLAMEWMAFSLEDLIRTHRGLPEEALKAVALQAVSGLQYLHDVKRVIHRDIKPHNLLIGAGGEVKLSDFGVSKVLETMQRPQTYVGTMLFMAPERLQDEPYDVSSDVWSLGVTLVAASNGRNPWSPPEDVTLFTLLRKLAGEDTPKLAPTFSEEARSFVSACLQRSPDARPTCRQLRQHPFLTSTTLDEARATMKQVVTLTMRMVQTSE